MGNEGGKELKAKSQSVTSDSRSGSRAGSVTGSSPPLSPLSGSVPEECLRKLSTLLSSSSSSSPPPPSPASLSGVTTVRSVLISDPVDDDVQTEPSLCSVTEADGGKPTPGTAKENECDTVTTEDIPSVSQHKVSMDIASSSTSSGSDNDPAPQSIEVSQDATDGVLSTPDWDVGTNNCVIPNGFNEEHSDSHTRSTDDRSDDSLIMEQDASDPEISRLMSEATTPDSCTQEHPERFTSASPSCPETSHISSDSGDSKLLDEGDPSKVIRSECRKTPDRDNQESLDHADPELAVIECSGDQEPESSLDPEQSGAALSSGADKVTEVSSDSECVDCEFSLSDIEDVVDADQSEDMIGSETDLLRSRDTANSQTEPASQTEFDQSPVTSNEKSLPDSGKCHGLSEPEVRQASNRSERDPNAVNTVPEETGDSAIREAELPVQTKAQTQDKNPPGDGRGKGKLSVKVTKENHAEGRFLEVSPVTPDAEDRIDKVCALLSRFKASRAAKEALDREGQPGPVLPSAGFTTPLCSTDRNNDPEWCPSERNAWKFVEDNDAAKSDRVWSADESDSDFPMHHFEQLSDEAEHRIAARRQARQAAREIRMREIERQQREAEEEGKASMRAVTNRPLLTSRHVSSRQDSEDTDDIQTLKKELYELDERYTKAMMDNAQLDNEKQMLRYEVDLLKDRFEDLSEEHTELQREYKDKCRECDHKKRENTDLTEEVAYLKQQLQQRDKLIEEYGLVFISNDTLTDDDNKERHRKATSEPGTTALVTPQAAEILKKHGEGSLDERLKQFDGEKKQLQEEIKKLKQLLDEEKERCALAEKYSTPPRVSQVSNGPDISELQMETQRMLNDYKFKLKKAQQDITTLEGNVIRLESQAKRYKQAAENSERNEEELKAEKRKLQRELREAQSQIEELQTSNQHLQKRMEKMKSARNAILKS